MKLTKCMLLMGMVIGGQSWVMSASDNKNMVMCENNSRYEYGVFCSVSGQRIGNIETVNVPSGTTAQLNISVEQMQNYVIQFPAGFEFQAVYVPKISRWLAATVVGAQDKSLIIGEHNKARLKSGLDYVRSIDPNKHGFKLIISEATTPEIGYQATLRS